MKRTIIYLLLATLLTACSADGPDAPAGNDALQMKLRFVTHSLSRAITGGAYSGPITGDKLTVSSYFTDPLGESQIYFSNLSGLTETSAGSGEWTATGWYWPLQGKMRFFNYWLDNTDASATFTEQTMPDGSIKPALQVNARNLDGYHDFVYGVSDEVDCPQSGAVSIPCFHGLAWINMRIYTEVYGADGVTYDPVTSEELVNNLTVNKLYLEQCARGADAIIIANEPVKWSIPSTKIKDQIYTWSTAHSSFVWNEVASGSDASKSSKQIPLKAGSEYTSYLGLYDPASPNHMNYGLLIVPQQKTAIVVEYVLTIGGTDISRTERFDLAGNGDWKPGSMYCYDIVFRNYSDLGATIDLVPTWTEVLYDTSNASFANGALGKFYVDNNGTVTSWNSQIIVDPMHNHGSMTGDEMDYKNGGIVF